MLTLYRGVSFLDCTRQVYNLGNGPSCMNDLRWHLNLHAWRIARRCPLTDPIHNRNTGVWVFGIAKAQRAWNRTRQTPMHASMQVLCVCSIVCLFAASGASYRIFARLPHHNAGFKSPFIYLLCLPFVCHSVAAVFLASLPLTRSQLMRGPHVLFT